MAGNTFGQLLRLTSFGESHGKAIGGILDGFPAGITINLSMIDKELARRRPGQSDLVSQRNEEDKLMVLSGIYEGVSLGTPIAFLIWNNDAKPSDYEQLKEVYRPSHADFTFTEKYGLRDHRGGGRSSARETIARVAAGAFAKQLLNLRGITISAFVSRIGDCIVNKEYHDLDLGQIEKSPVRCPDSEISQKMVSLISEMAAVGDTLGGIISCVVKGVDAGLGEPVFDKMHADLAKAMLSINAVKGFEIGSGFKAAGMKGSEHNDKFINLGGKIKTLTNFSGGIQGGITNGNDIYFNVAFKPVATLMMNRQTLDKDGNEVTLKPKGRHDVCVVPRAVPIVEAMAALVIADLYLRNKISKF